MHIDLSRPCYHYRVYDEAGELLYSGSTLNLDQRLTQHASSSRDRWWSKAARVESDIYPNQWRALLAERYTGSGRYGSILAGIGPRMAGLMTDDELHFAAMHPAYEDLKDRDLAERWGIPVAKIRALRSNGTR